MMRSLFSGISGLRVHQTRMDVIGHNISNVNTIGYKASRVTFAEVFSQTASGASPANADTGRGGTNPMQIGLGANIASIDKLMTQGAAQRTDNPFDLMIQGDGFFIVGDVSGQYFTRAGALNIDAAGNLVTTGGLTVMGWNQINKETGKIVQGVVQPIQIGPDKEYVPPSVTTQMNLTGNLNALNNTAEPKVMSMTIYDSVGNRYVVDIQMRYDPTVFNKGTANEKGGWVTELIPIAYPNGDRTKGEELRLASTGASPASPAVWPDVAISFTGNEAITGASPISIGTMAFDTDGNATAYVPPGGIMVPNYVDGTTGLPITPPATGTAISAFPPANARQVEGYRTYYAGTPATNFGTQIHADRSTQLVLSFLGGPSVASNASNATPTTPGTQNTLTPAATFGDSALYLAAPGSAAMQNAIIFDFSGLTQYGSNSDAIATRKDGNAPGTLNGLSIGTDGSVIGRYSNGEVKVLAQIPVAFFKNPAGMEKVGDNLYVPTGNSGEFNGTGDEITSRGGSIRGGVLEMSNVDLSNEFVDMITTQRGFQANSRIISTSDEMLQELVNLKR